MRRRCCKWIQAGLVLVLFASSAHGQRQVTTSVKDKSKPAANVPADSAYALPSNFYGAHLLVEDGLPGTRGYMHLRWARHLVGKWGYAKTLFMNIDKNTREPAQGWVDYVNQCYALELIPVVRLAGRMKDGQWVAPEADKPGDYSSMAGAIKRVVQGLPRSEMCPLYVEVWNEPNLAIEWTGRPDPQEYADFFVQTAAAMRSIGDERIKILNGALATSPEWTDKLCQANPQFVSSFDFWASHPYPHNYPPSINFHAKNVPAGSLLTIDSYLPEVDVLKKHGRADVKVMLTETGYDLGNSVAAQYPIIDEYNRADYIMRAFRDYWPQWPEIAAVFPFEFCNEGWERFNWVKPDSAMNQDGSPTRPHYQYTAVAALAKPTDATGAINGTITIGKLGTRMEGARVAIHLQQTGSVSDPMGNYFLPRLAPGQYRVLFSKAGFASVEKKVTVAKGTNTVLDVDLRAEELASLSGTVRSGDNGEPLKGVKLKLEPGGMKAETDEDGRYEIKECIPARYVIEADARGMNRYESAAVEVKLSGRNRHDFVMGKNGASSLANMMTNGGFEAGGGGGAKVGVALGFEPLVPAPVEFRDSFALISERFAHTGQFSQELRIRPEETAVRQITYYSTARPGNHYLAGAWVRVEAKDEEAAAWITLDADRNDGGVIKRSESKHVKARSGQWVWVETRCLAPEGSERISVGLHTKGPGGAAFFDDAILGIVNEKK